MIQAGTASRSGRHRRGRLAERQPGALLVAATGKRRPVGERGDFAVGGRLPGRGKARPDPDKVVTGNRSEAEGVPAGTGADAGALAAGLGSACGRLQRGDPAR